MEDKRSIIINNIKDMLSEYVELSGDLTPQMSLANDIGIDSFSLICLIGNIEERFKIQIPTKELSKFQTLENMVNYIEQNSNNI